MQSDHALTHFLARVLMYLLLLILGWSVLSYLSLVLAPVGVGFVLAFLLDPSVRALERRGVPRWLAVGGIVLAFLGVMTFVAILLPTLISGELDYFAAKVPEYRKLLDTKLLPLADKWLKTRAHTVNDYLKLLTDRISDWARGAAGQISVALGSVLLRVASLLKYVIAILLAPIFAVSFLMNMPHMRNTLRMLVPPRFQHFVGVVVYDIYIALGGWLRGQLIVMTVQAILYSIGLSLTGIPLAIVIGCTAGFLAFVPYVGVSIGLVAALTVALFEVASRGATPILGVLVTFGAVQLLDAVVITPAAVGGRIGLSAVGVIFSLSLGGTLLGYVGLLLAVPVAAIIKVLLPHLLNAYKATAYYGATHPPSPALPGAAPSDLAPSPSKEEPHEA